MSTGVNNLLDAAGKLVKVVPTAYEDLLQPTVVETGQIISKIPKAINAALIGVDCWVEEKKYKLDETKKLLEHKLENIDPSKIVAPESYVAVPALQAIPYSMNSEELRDLYTNLLANAMNVDTKDSVHPSFVEIIKQLSPLDARLIKHIKNNSYRLATITFRFQKNNLTSLGLIKSSHSFDIVSNVICTPFPDIPYDYIQMSLDNLSRLGLIHIDYSKCIDDESLYTNILEAFLESIELMVKKAFTESKYQDYKITPVKGKIYSNTLFKLFCDVCV